MPTDHEMRIAYLEKQILELRKRVERLETLLSRMLSIVRALRG